MSEVHFIMPKEMIDDNSKAIVNAAMQDFLTIDDDGCFLLKVIKSIISNEGTGTEVSSVFISTDPEGVDDIFYHEDLTDFIVIGYFDDYVVFPLNSGIEYISDWCAEHASSVQNVLILCAEMKKLFSHDG